MILVFDPVVLGASHVPFNSALLSILCKAYPQDSVIMCAVASHTTLLKRAPGLDRVVFRSFPEDWRENFREELPRLIRELNPTNVVLCGCSASKLSIVRKVARRQSNVSFDCVTHGELAEPAGWRSRNPWHRRNDFFGIVGRGFSSNVRFVVLEHAIVDKLRQIAPRRQLVSALPHPLSCLGEGTAHEQADKHRRAVISFVGGTFRSKGFATFVECARRFGETFDFRVIGARAHEYDPALDDLFTVPPSVEKLERDVFEAALLETDVICLPLDPVRYSWSASGTLLDAIALDIQLLTMRTAVTRDWETRYGEFGLLADNETSMIEQLEAIRSGMQPWALTDDQRRSREKIKKERAVDRLACTFSLLNR